MDTISQAQPARTIRFTSSLVFRNSFTNQWNQLIDHWQDGRYKRSKLARGMFKTRKKKKKKFKKRGREGGKKRIALHARWTISKTRNETRCTVERVGTDRRSVVPRARAPDSILNRLSGVPSISNWRDNKFYVPPLGVGRLFPVASPRISSPIKFKRFATPGFPPSSATEGGSGVGAGKEGGGLLQQRQIAARVFDWYSTNLMAPDGAMDEHLPSRIDEHPRSGSLTLFVRCNDPLSSYVSLFLILFRFFEWEKIERTEVDVCCSFDWKFATFCPVLFM